MRFAKSGRLLAALAMAACAASPAPAQEAADFPAGTVRILVPFAAGGPTDVVARILAELLAERWGGKSVVVEDRPGAGTIVATAAIAKAQADGHTIGIATNSFLINPAIRLKLPYDTHADFVSITMIATQPVALVANAAFPANTLAELIDVAKKSPEPLNYTSPGPRGVGHLAGEMLKQRAGINMQHISYNGSAPALNDVMGGRVPLMFDIWHSARRYVETGQLKLIAGAGTTAARRREGADHRADLSRLQRRRLQRHDRASRHPGARARQAFGLYRRGGRLAGIRRTHPFARHRRPEQHAAPARRLVRQGNGKVGRDRQGGESQGGVRGLSLRGA